MQRSSVILYVNSKNTVEEIFFHRILIFIQLSSLYHVIDALNNAALGENSAKRIKRINRGILAYNRTGVKNTSASNVSVVAEDTAYLAKSGFIFNVTVNHNVFSVRLKI